MENNYTTTTNVNPETLRTYVSIVGKPVDLSKYVERLTIVYYHKGDKSGQKRVMRER